MIAAVQFPDGHLEVEVSGGGSDPIQDFTRSMRKLASAIPASERTFDSDRKVWIVKNPEKFFDVDFVKRAARQLPLFE